MRRTILGGCLLAASVLTFVLTWQSIAWMIDGGWRDHAKLGVLLLSLAVGLRGVTLMCRRR
jgi:hypothetical protein